MWCVAYLHSQRLDVVGAVRSPGEVGQVELDLVPAVVQPHGHGADEGLHTRGALIVTRSEAPPHVLIIQNLNFECEILLEVFDDHDEERKLDAEGFLGVCRTRDVCGAHVGSLHLQHQRLDVIVCDALYVSVSDLLVPYLQGFAADTVEDGQKSALECIFEHNPASALTSDHTMYCLLGSERVRLDRSPADLGFRLTNAKQIHTSDSRRELD